MKSKKPNSNAKAIRELIRSGRAGNFLLQLAAEAGILRAHGIADKEKNENADPVFRFHFFSSKKSRLTRRFC